MHIGLFDSGVGGLTVLKEIKKFHPQARFSYLGDTARLPYGNKAPETLKKYTAQNISFLESKGVDAVVIACHSASSVALDILKTQSGIPVYNVITPSCLQAIHQSSNQIIGVIATTATVKSQVYKETLLNMEPKATVIAQACPLLVPLVEEGWVDDEVTQLILQRYLQPLLQQKIDSLILACTHYPILAHNIAKICGPQVQLINPAESVAQNIITTDEIDHSDETIPIYLTDHAPHFLTHAKTLLGAEIAFEIRTPES